MAEYSVLGKRTVRKECAPKAKGEAIFTVDITLPQMLCGKVLTSSHAHAKIVNIDTNKAKRLRGVKAVITGRDVPHVPCVKAFGPPLPSDIYPMTSDKVRYIGDLVAGVAAIDEDAAEEAIELIEVEYEILPALFDPEEAMHPEAIRIHDGAERNIPVMNTMECGDVEKGFKECDYVREDTFRFPLVAYCHPEPQNTVASFDPASGMLTVWASIQDLTGARKQLSDLFEMPMTKIRVVAPYVGGGYGGRLGVPFQAPFIAAFLSKKTERPVKLVYDREQEFSTYWQAMNQAVVTLKTGVKKGGTLIAREAFAIFDVGAYKGPIKGPVPQAYVSGLNMPYKIPNLKLTGISVYTNKQSVGPFRGYGEYQGAWSAELQMDMIARELGIDPMEMRLANAVEANTVTPLGWTIGSCGLTKCIQQAAKTIDWDVQGESRPANRGKGVSTSWFGSGGGGSPRSPLVASVRINADGTVDLMQMGTDSGSGQYAGLSIMVAEELGIPLEDVTRPMPDTGLFPDEWHPVTVTLSSYGRATRAAAVKARQMLVQAVADKMEANADDLECRGGRVYVKGSPDKGMAFAEAARIATAMKGPIVARGESYNAVFNRLNEREVEERYMNMSFAAVSPAFSFGAAAAEVEVDKETGIVRILRLAHAYDVGLAVNPMEVEGQLQGAAAMAIGRALTEELLYDNGQLLNPSYLNYKVLTAQDMPQVTPIIVEETDDPEVVAYGVKELGMGALSACTSAIASAVYNATGVMIKEFPITPEKLLRALEAKKQETREKE